jgi:PKD repeat protein
MQPNKKSRKCESGVSETIGAILLVALAVTAIAIIGVMLFSQPPPQKIPAVETVISNEGSKIQITHNGGDTLRKEDFVILVDGVPQPPENVFKGGTDSSWESWSPGEALTIQYEKPGSVRIVYSGAGASSVLSSAVFGPDGQPTAQFTITSSVSGGPGTVSPDGIIPTFYGTTPTFTFTPGPNYHLQTITVDGTPVTPVGNSYTFPPVTASHNIVGTFAPDSYTITATSGANGNVTPAGITTVDYGGSQTYTITPITGYQVLDVLVDGSSVGNVATYSFTNVAASHTISATFAINTYTITATSGANGNVTPAGITPVNYGGSQAYTITPITGYKVLDVLVDGSSVGNVTTYSFTNVAASHTISATFTPNTYTITATSGANGNVTPAGITTVNYGGSQAYAITPITGYKVLDVLVDGSSVGNVTTYSFTNVVASHTISATFAINTYTITATSGANGNVTPAGITTVNYGGSQAYAITPITGYKVLDVLVDGSSVGNVTTYSFTNVAASHTISATFTPNTYTITATSGANGNVTPAGITTVNYGGSQAYAITPITGYKVLDVLVDGSSVGNVATYSFTNVAASHTISATFAINTYTITATNDTFGAVTPAGVTTVNYGATPTYTITPNTGYHVSDVTVNGASVGAVTSYVFPAVTNNMTISGTFAINTYTITPSILRANGTVSPDTVQIVNYGATPTFTFTNATGYRLYTVTVNGTAVTPIGNSYTFPPVTTNKTLVGTFMIDPPVADFTGSPRPGAIPLNVTFTDLSTNSPTSWIWNFGDGNYAYVKNPTNTYSSAGNYSVRLEVANEGGSNATEKAGYVFTYVPAVANFTNSTGYPRTGPASLTVYFTDLSTGSPYNFLWHFGDIAIVNTSTLQNPGHTYDDIGLYSVNLTVANSYSSSSLVRTGYINVTTPIPEVYIFPNTTSGYAPLPVLFEGLASNSPTSWLWDFGDGTPTVTTKDATHTFANSGSYNVSLTATNAGGSGIAYQMITVNALSITASSGANGNVTPSGETLVNYGGSQTYAITPITGYKVANVLVDNVSNGTISSYTFTNVTTNHTISATFAIKTFNITATAGANGAIIPNGTVTLNYGDSQEFTFVPDRKYHTQTMVVDGVTTNYPPKIDSPYTFSNVQDNHTISVTFASNARQEIFFETFDGSSGTWPYTGTIYEWTRASTNVVTSNTVNLYNGTYSIRIRNKDWMSKTISTQGYDDIIVAYKWGAAGVSTTEYTRSLYSTNSSGITNVLAARQGTLSPITTVTSSILPASTNDNPLFGLRFQIYGSSNTDYLYIDDVKVTGIPYYI